MNDTNQNAPVEPGIYEGTIGNESEPVPNTNEPENTPSSPDVAPGQSTASVHGDVLGI